MKNEIFSFVVWSVSYNCLHEIHAFFLSNAFFNSDSIQCCLTSSWIELQMLLRCWVIYITIIILKHILYLVYLCRSLCLGLFLSHLCDLFFIFSLIFIVINHMTSLRQMHLSFVNFLEYLLLFLDDNVYEESEKFSNKESSASGCCLVFAYFFANFSQVLLIKVFLIKKSEFPKIKLVIFSFRLFWQKWNFISGEKCYVNTTPKWNHLKRNICTCEYFIKINIADQKIKTKVNFISFCPQWKLMLTLPGPIPNEEKKLT